MVRALLEAGADLSARNNVGRTPLHAAAASAELGESVVAATAAFAALLAAGADPNALDDAGIMIDAEDIVLFYTDHYRRRFGTNEWMNGPGLSANATRWLGEWAINAFGVETPSAGVSGVSNKEVHRICGELALPHYENLINLYQLVGRGRFTFMGLPLKIRGGTGSPVRAIAIFE